MNIYDTCKVPHLAVSTASSRYKCKCNRCKEYQSHRRKRYKNKLSKEHKKNLYNQHYKKQRQELNEYKKLLSCHDCGYNKNYAILEFHHLIPIKNEKRNSNPRFLIKEHKIGNTVCLCPTCHAERHFNPNTGMIDLHYVKV